METDLFNNDIRKHLFNKFTKEQFLQFIENNAIQNYLDLCKIAINKNGLILNHIDYDKLPLENRDNIYLDLCKNAIKQVDYALNYINYEWLPQENREQIYFNLYKDAIYENGFLLKFIDYNNLFEKNKINIYPDLCKYALNKNSFLLEFINYDFLPQQNREQIYTDLCKIAIAKDNATLKFIDFNKLTNNDEIKNLYKIAITKLKEQYSDVDNKTLKNYIKDLLNKNDKKWLKANCPDKEYQNILSGKDTNLIESSPKLANPPAFIKIKQPGK